MFYILLLLVVLAIYWYTTRNHNYWSKRGVKHEKTIPIFGNHFRNFFGLNSITTIADELYYKYKDEKVVGYYRGNTPELLIRDPDLVRQILNVDFGHFFMRGLGRNTDVEPLLLSLFHAEGDTWKLLRQRLTTAFTNNKLKNMFPLVVKCADKLNAVADKVADKDIDYDVREMMARFTTEFIGACGFGIEMDTINDERSQFRELGKKMFNQPLRSLILFQLNEIFPEFLDKVYVGEKSVEVAMTDIFLRIRDQRNGKPIGRNDFIDLLLELENNQKIVGESLEKVNPDGTIPIVSMEMTTKCMIAQLFVFFAAGFETSSSATSYLLHELALNPDVQSRIQAEIDEVMARYENKLCYDSIMEMSLLEKAFKESMRMFPSLGILNRECTRKYTIPGLDITIDPGTKIIIPIQALQNDEQYFPNPKQFDPDRFNAEEVKNRHKFVYLPFGEGPRACIGARLGYMQSLAGLTAVLHKFSFEPGKTTERYLKPNPTSNVVQAVKNGVPLRLKNRKSKAHSVDSVASYSSQNHVDRIRTQNFSAASCQEDGDFGSIKTSLFTRSSSNLEIQQKRPESVISNTSSTRSRLREFVERKASQEETVVNVVGDIQYFGNPTETLEFDKPTKEAKKEERPKKRKLSKSKDKDKDKDLCETKNKKHEKYQSKLAEYYKVPAAQLPQDEFYQHLTRSKAAEELLQKRFTNSATEFSGSYGRLCKHKEPEGSNLRRSRSLAVIREETFTDLQIQNHSKSKRSQLIPRARLFDKPCFKDRLPGRAKYQTKEEVLESIYIDSTASCFGDINAQKENETPAETEAKSEKEEVRSRRDSTHSRSISGSWPNLADDIKQTNLSEDSIGHSRNPSEIDSLDSNYVRKHYNFEAHLKQNYNGSSPESERSVVSPNDSKQLYITTDDLDTESEARDRSKNNTPKSYTNDSLSISRSEKDKATNNNSTADEKPHYDEVADEVQKSEHNTTNTPCITTQVVNDDSQSVLSENDGTISSPESITSYISISIASSTDKSHKLEYLANSLAEKIDEYCESQFHENNSVSSRKVNSEKNHEVDPIYTRVNKKRTFADIRKDSFLSKSSNSFNEVAKKPNSEVYISNTYIESDDYSTRSEQRLCTSTKNITTEPFVTTLIENQYYSLPDINISKCLRKSERIDAQLREEDPEDIPCENTYEIAHSNFREILSTKTNNTYGQLNQTRPKPNQTDTKSSNIYLPEYSEPEIIQNFSQLEDDLKSIITIESSNADDRDYYRTNTHQNEREINEIENTIRNTKLITKSESLKIANSVYRPQINLSKSYSNDNINVNPEQKKYKTALRKHYSLRQRDPYEDVIDRMPSPNTFAKSLNKALQPRPIINQNLKDIKTKALVSRVQSFKTSAESNIAIIPLSGHQTIVIDPPHDQYIKEQNKNTIVEKNSHEAFKAAHLEQPLVEKTAPDPTIQEKKEAKLCYSLPTIDTSSYFTPKDPFITIKLNKVVKTTIPKLKKETSDKIAAVQYKFEKPPGRLIIKDNKNSKESSIINKTNIMRPQILQVVDSRSKKQTVSMPDKLDAIEPKERMQTVSQVDLNQKKVEISDNITSVREKLNNAIKTDMEYQEKLHSVKNYWSKLIENTPEKEITKQENKSKSEDRPSMEPIKNNHFQINDTKEETKCSPEISVGTIIKSIESVKIVDSIRKLSQTKLQLWKDETEKVKSDSEIEETTVKKIIKDCEVLNHEITKSSDKITKKQDPVWTRDTPEIEIVELSSDDNKDVKTQATLIKAKGFDKSNDEFDHVRYKVMKSELFKNSMIANYRKEAQFDGLLQYLQDYSFQELLVNNNIVIIEPVRTKIEPAQKKITNTNPCKIPPNLLKKNDGCMSHTEKSKNAIRRHFFYHPIRVNKEIIEEELPNPDTVKKVRNLFEDTLKMKSPMTNDPPLVEDDLRLTRRATSYRNLNEDSKGNKIGVRKKVIRQLTIDTSFGNKKWDNASLSSGVSSGDLSSNNEYDNDGLSPYSHKKENTQYYSSSDEYLCDSINHDFCCESQYVSPDIMKKIRECGTSITYYGGKVLNSKTGSIVSPMTKAIMEEIKGLQKNCSRDCYSCQTKCRGEKCNCLISDKHKQIETDNKQGSSTSSDSGNHDHDKRNESFPGFKFKLVKSNSCSSRLELTGTDEIKNARNRYRKFPNKADDPPIVYDDENSVKNKICRLESYSKGIVNTPFENKDDDDEVKFVPKISLDAKKIKDEKKIVEVKPQQNPNFKKEDTKQHSEEPSRKDSISEKQNADAHAFEKKFYYVNENTEPNKTTTGKFGEMVFEEFEVLETCYDSLNSNKSMK